MFWTARTLLDWGSIPSGPPARPTYWTLVWHHCPLVIAAESCAHDRGVPAVHGGMVMLTSLATWQACGMVCPDCMCSGSAVRGWFAAWLWDHRTWLTVSDQEAGSHKEWRLKLWNNAHKMIDLPFSNSHREGAHSYGFERNWWWTCSKKTVVTPCGCQRGWTWVLGRLTALATNCQRFVQWQRACHGAGGLEEELSGMGTLTWAQMCPCWQSIRGANWSNRSWPTSKGSVSMLQKYKGCTRLISWKAILIHTRLVMGDLSCMQLVMLTLQVSIGGGLPRESVTLATDLSQNHSPV